jgi:uncharacterized FAD-dependent dehydrogenase
VIQTIDIRVSPEVNGQPDLIRNAAIRAAGLASESVNSVEVIRRSLDARQRPAVYQLRCRLHIGEDPLPEPLLSKQFREVSTATEVIIVGAGPAGYFAALECLRLGLKPIVYDRGHDAQLRRRDLRDIQQFGLVNPESNYCFGEGGAGTYSDGKLYTRSVKRGHMESVLKLLVEHGAKSDILIDAHPHIGSNKLPGVIMNIRATILHYGGEVHFSSKITALVMKAGKVIGVRLENQQERLGGAVILATGHSARDIFTMLNEMDLAIEFKPFALGVRIEHPQWVIDQNQYGQKDRGILPPSSYSLVCQVGKRGVFSFCMCPGGLIVPAATAPGELVVNGMSLSRRDSPYANSGTVVAVEWEDLKSNHHRGVFAGLDFQASIEKAFFNAGDGSQKAPAQRLKDFIKGQVSTDLPGTSYIPGIYPGAIDKLLPDWITRSLQQGIREFDKKMKGYLMDDAIMVGVESRTSSPVRIPRASDTRMHPQAPGLFPCGEGAGYAGGILSAAMDGQNTAQAVSRFLFSI